MSAHSDRETTLMRVVNEALTKGMHGVVVIDDTSNGREALEIVERRRPDLFLPELWWATGPPKPNPWNRAVAAGLGSG